MQLSQLRPSPDVGKEHAFPRDLLLDRVATVANNLGNQKLLPVLLLRHMAPPVARNAVAVDTDSAQYKGSLRARLEGISHLDPKNNSRLLYDTPPELQRNSDAHIDAHLLASHNSRDEAPMADHSSVPDNTSATLPPVCRIKRRKSQPQRPTCMH